MDAGSELNRRRFLAACAMLGTVVLTPGAGRAAELLAPSRVGTRELARFLAISRALTATPELSSDAAAAVLAALPASERRRLPALERALGIGRARPDLPALDRPPLRAVAATVLDGWMTGVVGRHAVLDHNRALAWTAVPGAGAPGVCVPGRASWSLPPGGRNR